MVFEVAALSYHLIIITFHCHDCLTDIPGRSDDFCRDKANGWYALLNYGYTQCVAGRQLYVRNCGSHNVWQGAMGFVPQTCYFCATSCQCEKNCWGDSDKGSEFTNFFDHNCSYQSFRRSLKQCRTIVLVVI